MSICDDCIFAEWDRTSDGRLHPSKKGRCTRLDKHPLDLRLPAAFHWSLWVGSRPKPMGGDIRGGEVRAGQPHHAHTCCAFKRGIGDGAVKPSCHCCRFNNYSNCQRFPPAINRDQRFPHVGEWNLWCGEFQPKENDEIEE